MLKVHADIYNLSMPTRLVQNTLIIKRKAGYNSIVGHAGILRKHTVTAIAIISIPVSITKPEDAMSYAKKYLEHYERLLSFAQGHDIFFYNYRCVEQYENGKRKTVLSIPFEARLLGKPTGSKIVIDLQEYLDIAIPLMQDAKYSEKTGIKQALIFYNQATSIDALELKMALYFLGIETLTNAYYASNKIKSKELEPLFDSMTWQAIFQAAKTALKTLDVSQTLTQEFLGKLGQLNTKSAPSLSTEERIKALCEALGLKRYVEIDAMTDMRNDVLHGQPPKRNYGDLTAIDVLQAAERLLEKLILKQLNYYKDWPKVHGAIMKDDLFATS